MVIHYQTKNIPLYQRVTKIFPPSHIHDRLHMKGSSEKNGSRNYTWNEVIVNTICLFGCLVFVCLFCGFFFCCCCYMIPLWSGELWEEERMQGKIVPGWSGPFSQGSVLEVLGCYNSRITNKIMNLRSLRALNKNNHLLLCYSICSLLGCFSGQDLLHKAVLMARWFLPFLTPRSY